MLVRLKRDIYIEETLYRCVPHPTFLPDRFKDRLPEDAVIVKAVPVESKKKETLRDFDEIRAAEEAITKKTKG